MAKTINQKLDDLEKYIDELDFSDMPIDEIIAKIQLGAHKVAKINNVTKKMDDHQKLRMKYLAYRLLNKTIRLR